MQYQTSVHSSLSIQETFTHSERSGKFSVRDAISIHQKIHARALEISHRYQKSEAELIEVLAQVEDHQVYLHRGYSSLFQYGVSELKLSENVVYSLIAGHRILSLQMECG